MGSRVGFAEQEVVVACIEGAISAWKEYEDWVGAGGELLGRRPRDSAPEFFLQCGIAKALRKVTGIAFVTLEESARNLSAEHSGRIDVTAWSAEQDPKVLVEVKRGWAGLGKQVAQAHRIASARGGGCIALGVACKRSKSEQEWLDDLAKPRRGLHIVQAPQTIELRALFPSGAPDGRSVLGVAVYRAVPHRRS